VDPDLRFPVPGTQSPRLQHGSLDFCLFWTAVIPAQTCQSERSFVLGPPVRHQRIPKADEGHFAKGAEPYTRRPLSLGTWKRVDDPALGRTPVLLPG